MCYFDILRAQFEAKPHQMWQSGRNLCRLVVYIAGISKEYTNTVIWPAYPNHFTIWASDYQVHG